MLAMLKNWATRLIANVMAVIHRYITGETIMSADQQQHHRLTATALSSHCNCLDNRGS
jgi:hypothetical protein